MWCRGVRRAAAWTQMGLPPRKLLGCSQSYGQSYCLTLTLTLTPALTPTLTLTLTLALSHIWSQGLARRAFLCSWWWWWWWCLLLRFCLWPASQTVDRRMSVPSARSGRDRSLSSATLRLPELAPSLSQLTDLRMLLLLLLRGGATPPTAAAAVAPPRVGVGVRVRVRVGVGVRVRVSTRWSAVSTRAADDRRAPLATASRRPPG